MVRILANAYESAAFLLTVAVLVIILLRFANETALSAVFLLMLLILTLHKAGLNERMDKLEESREKYAREAERISQAIDSIFRSVEKLREEMWKGFFAVENRMEAQRNDFETKLRVQYRELAAKIIELENKLNKTKKEMEVYLHTEGENGGDAGNM